MGFSHMNFITVAAASCPAVCITSARTKAATGVKGSDGEVQIRVMAQLRHPNLLPLLASAITWEAGGARQQVAYMLFPLYPGDPHAPSARSRTAAEPLPSSPPPNPPAPPPPCPPGPFLLGGTPPAGGVYVVSLLPG